jgi:hypothetical protein
MFAIIFGWNHPETKQYGAIEPNRCSKCRNTEPWILYRLSRWFTLFFIPIFPHGYTYWHSCPICSHSLDSKYEAFKIYKEIAKINLAYADNKIDALEKLNQLKELHEKIRQSNEDQAKKDLEKSDDFKPLVMAKSDEALLGILNGDKNDYSPAFLISVEREVKFRGLKMNE